MTNEVKSISIKDPNFNFISNKIFELNQKRFRIKNWYNLLTVSNIKEQKSYQYIHYKIIIDNEDTFFNKLSEINYLSLECDVLTIECSFSSLVKNIFKTPTIIYHEEHKQTLNDPIIIDLSNFSIPNDESAEVFSLKPIVYITGGKLGDLIQSLSVICEKFYETGRKGILYMSEKAENFHNGLKNTYNDIYPVIIKQKYIQDLKIYTNETYDIELTSWRVNLVLKNWYDIFNEYYNIKWGQNKWIEAPFSDRWINKIVINTTSYRFPTNIDFNLLNDLCFDNLIFISSDKSEYEFFQEKTKCNIEYCKFNSFLDLITIINSCKLFIGGLSAPLAIAHALHKNRICCLRSDGCDPDSIMNMYLDQIIPNLRYSL
jgi:hypothetical protein